MSRPLYNHDDHLNPNMNIMAPIANRPKANMGAYPGGVNYLTPKIINNRGINTTVFKNTNGRIAVTIETRSRDQQYINANQLLFLDVKGKSAKNPKLCNVQQLNEYLAFEFPTFIEKQLKGTNKNPFNGIVKHKGRIINRNDVEKNEILDRFKLYGSVVNRDPDMNNSMQIERIARAITCTVRGVTHILDYWSTKDRRLQPYDKCFFVLKKVKMTDDMRFQPNLNAVQYRDAGKRVPDEMIGAYRWQILPYNCSENILPKSAYIGDDGSVGYFWALGNIHEYPDILHESMFQHRKDHTAMQDISHLHGNGHVKPIHFYLKIDPGSTGF